MNCEASFSTNIKIPQTNKTLQNNAPASIVFPALCVKSRGGMIPLSRPKQIETNLGTKLLQTRPHREMLNNVINGD